MIAAARARPVPDRVSFALGDLRDWRPGGPVDVIVSNAVLQWVPGHLDLVRHWAGTLAAGGWLAFQLPGNFDQPSHALLRDLAGSGRWRSRLAGVELNRQAGDPAQYADLLLSGRLPGGRLGDHVPACAAGRRPGPGVVQGHRAAPGPLGAGFRGGGRVLARNLDLWWRRPTPAASYGTILPFRRVFVVAQAPG